MSAAAETRGSGRGKVILLGEHAVVYGQPALAAALDLGVEVRARRVAPGGAVGRLRVPAWGIDLRADDEATPARALRAIEAALGLPAAAHDIDATATVPARAGLGSSAAFAVATARALAPGLDDERAIAVAQAAEQIFHGRPSGIDVTMAVRGGVGLFRRESGLAPVAAPATTLVIGLSGEPRDTAARVADVAQKRAEAPAATDAKLSRLGELARAGAEALAAGDLPGLGRLFDEAQQLLAAGLALSTPRLDALCAAARAAGALGAKLTGAGGGGAMIALCRAGESDSVTRALAALGAPAHVVTVGGAP